MLRRTFASLAHLTAFTALAAMPVHAQAEQSEAGHVLIEQALDFGDDASDFANDGECDDLRFVGDGMTQTPLLPEDAYRDASDCSRAFSAKTIVLAPLFVNLGNADGIVWGDDNGEFARDGECDDMRFDGRGMTFTPLLADDIGHDATDCRAAFEKGSIFWRTGAVGRLDEPANYV